VLPDRVELRVVPLPPGADPADIVGEEGGAERMRALLEGAVPFARFAIERILERGHDDEALTQVGAVIKPLPQGILRDGLIQLASSRLGISPDLVESAVRSARPLSAAAPETGGTPRSSNGARQAINRREQSERAFLSLCVALPELGEQKLAATDLDAVFTSPLTRLAAERLRGHLEHPASVISEAPELAELIPEIVLRAGQLDATPATLELEALQLDLHRLDREITAARTGGEAEVHGLAAERQKVLDAIRHRLQ
jgi:DNA primase